MSEGSLYRWRFGLLRLDSFDHSVRVGLSFNPNVLHLTSNTGVYYWSNQPGSVSMHASAKEFWGLPPNPVTR